MQLRDKALALPVLEGRAAALQREIQQAENELSVLMQQCEKESRDVARIQSESLSAFLLRLAGKYEDKLEKEQREEVEAKLAYDRAETRLKGLRSKAAELAVRIAESRECARVYEGELDKKRRELDRASGPAGERYAELQRERHGLISQITEVKEALAAAVRAKATAAEALDALESARGWATFDAITRGGIISHMAKYSHIDSAEQSFHVLSSQLRELRSELNDVPGLTVAGLSEISSGQRMIDFWFDNIFTDLSVRGQIMDNAVETERLLRSIGNAEAVLKARLAEAEGALTENGRREEELLHTLINRDER